MAYFVRAVLLQIFWSPCLRAFRGSEKENASLLHDAAVDGVATQCRPRSIVMSNKQ